MLERVQDIMTDAGAARRLYRHRPLVPAGSEYELVDANSGESVPVQCASSDPVEGMMLGRPSVSLEPEAPYTIWQCAEACAVYLEFSTGPEGSSEAAEPVLERAKAVQRASGRYFGCEARSVVLTFESRELVVLALHQESFDVDALSGSLVGFGGDRGIALGVTPCDQPWPSVEDRLVLYAAHLDRSGPPGQWVEVGPINLAEAAEGRGCSTPSDGGTAAPFLMGSLFFPAQRRSRGRRPHRSQRSGQAKRSRGLDQGARSF
ncbi:MAG: hypothetical protein KUG77_28535 [Nannocystaceae bacterium]|nr:hypothetical protein [Nannocystaceae bacterium]